MARKLRIRLRQRQMRLLWKLLIPAVLVFCALAAMMILRSWHSLNRQLIDQTDQLLFSDARVLHSLYEQLDSEYAHVAAEILNALATNPDDDLQNHIENSADLFVRLNWVAAFDDLSNPVAFWSASLNDAIDELPLSPQLLAKLQRADRPLSSVFCIDTCEYILAVPRLSEAGVPGESLSAVIATVILVSVPLGDLLSPYAQLTGGDVALASVNANAEVSIFSTTLAPPMQNELSQMLRNTSSDSGVLRAGGQSYSWRRDHLGSGLSGEFPVVESADRDTTQEVVVGLVLRNITADLREARDQIIAHLLQFVVMLGLAVGLLSWVLQGRLSRLSRLTAVLPRLSEDANHEATRQALIGASPPGRYYDEMDSLRDNLLFVSERLEKLHDAEAASDAKSRFLATMSHEIRTPMSGILGLTEILAQGRLDSDQRRMAQMVHDSTHNLLHIINDVLDYSKIEAGAAELDPVTFAPSELVETVADLVAVSAARKNLRLKTISNPCLPFKLVGDAGKLRQILLNLVSNAIKFTESGSVTLHWDTTAVDESHSEIKIVVSDTGVGIKDEAQKHVFQRFRQADASTTRQFGGTGLGLAICEGLVHLMGGTLQLQSTWGVGTTFTVHLRLPKAESQPDLRSQCPDLKGYRVQLQLDADESEYFAELLTSHGAEVVVGRAPSRTSEQENVDRPQLIVSNLAGGDATQIELQYRDGPTERSVTLSRPIKESTLTEQLITVATGNSSPSHQARSKVLRQFGARILVAEDQPVNRELLGRQLRALGCEALLCTNGTEAVELLKDGEPFDIIITDLHMPDMDGYGLVRWVREHVDPKIREMPVVVLTASASSKDLATLNRSGVNRKLVKPASIAALEQCLADFCTDEMESLEPVPVGEIEAEPHRELPILDQSLLEDVFGDDMGSVAQFRDMYLESTRPLLDACQQAINNNEWGQLKDSAHKLVGSTRSLGGARLAALFKDVELQAEQSSSEAKTLFAAAETMLSRFLVELDALLAGANKN